MPRHETSAQKCTYQSKTAQFLPKISYTYAALIKST